MLFSIEKKSEKKALNVVQKYIKRKNAKTI